MIDRLGLISFVGGDVMAARTGEQKSKDQFDLVERTARFGEDAIRLARSTKIDAITSPLVKQFLRSATSVGANYCEADEASSKKEFRYRISVCNREVRETKHWLRMLAVATPSSKQTARNLWKEANELNLIFSTIHHRSQPKPRTQTAPAGDTPTNDSSSLDH